MKHNVIHYFISVIHNRNLWEKELQCSYPAFRLEVSFSQLSRTVNSSMDIWHFLFLYKKEVSLIQLSTEKRNQSGHFKSLSSRGTATFKVLSLCSICYFCWWMLDIDRRYVPDIAYLTRCIHSSITRDIEFQLLYTIPRKFIHSLGTIHV